VQRVRLFAGLEGEAAAAGGPSARFRWVFCPHCGKRNEEGARYCNACGGALPELGAEADQPAEADRSSRRRALSARVRKLVGQGRRERLITAATIVALAVAAVAVISLATDGLLGGDEDEYSRQADRVCVEQKQALALLVEEGSTAPGLREQALRWTAAAQVVTDWRRRLGSIEPSPPDAEAVAELDVALGELEVAARAAGASAGDSGVDTARGVSQAIARLESAIDALGLEACAEVPLAAGDA
jgi:hypothetical protein